MANKRTPYETRDDMFARLNALRNEFVFLMRKENLQHLTGVETLYLKQSSEAMFKLTKAKLRRQRNS